jgi:glycosyltransferase involved in cell wall biosynthesis
MTAEKSITLMPTTATIFDAAAKFTGTRINMSLSRAPLPEPLAAPARQSLARIAVLVPARDPDRNMVPLVASLLQLGFGAIIVVNDGSSSASAEVFAELGPLDRVHLLRHAINLGKGRALKNGINYFLGELPAFDVLVTADADGQHTPTDIARVAHAALEASGKIVLGSRGFVKNIPLRSRVGNGLTRHIFAFVTGTKLADTQTGLRAFPRAMLPSLMVLDGERYEYEMTVLAHICCIGSKPLEVPIETVYIDGNRSSHFDPILDSMRIYFVLARFFLSSIIAAGIDFFGFTVTYALTGNVLAGVIIGRLSSLVNFALNKKFVFHSRASVASSLWRYYVLVAAIAALSYGLIWTLVRRLHWNVFASKVIVDVLLSLVSFSVQRTFVFRKTEES